jgi:ankyrin repeat protein
MMRWPLLATLLIGLSISSGYGAGTLTSSQHITEQYNNAFAAASSGDLTTLQNEIGKDPTILKATEWGNRTLLHDAADKGQTEVAKYLISKGINVNAMTSDNRTALHMAAQHGDLPMIALLLGHGATINTRDGQGWTPLDRAIKWGHTDAVSYLRAHGATGSVVNR